MARLSSKDLPTGTTIPSSPKQPLVYVAGPYRSATEWGLINNIRHAEELALSLWKKGASVICPHKNTAHFGGAADDCVWLSGDLVMVSVCHAVFCTANWALSAGATGEVAFAISRDIPVFDNVEDFTAWRRDWELET